MKLFFILLITFLFAFNAQSQQLQVKEAQVRSGVKAEKVLNIQDAKVFQKIPSSSIAARNSKSIQSLPIRQNTRGNEDGEGLISNENSSAIRSNKKHSGGKLPIKKID